MKNLVIFAFVVCLASVLATSSRPPTSVKDHFTAVCESGNKATLTVDTKFVAEGLGTCKPTNNGRVYILTNDCLTVGKFVIKPAVSSNNKIRGGHGARIYSLSCQMAGDGQMQNVKLTFHQQNPSSTPVAATFTPPPVDLKMSLFTNKPDVSMMTSQSTIAAYLGQALYLTIYHNHSTNDLIQLIPLTCQAQTKSATDNLSLWKLHDTSKCFYEPAVMGGMFTSKTVDKYDVVYAELDAFEFAKSTGVEITISCEIRVCHDIKAGECLKDYSVLSSCQTPTPTTTPGSKNPVIRRRRDVGMEEKRPTELHRVTATLRIRDDVMATDSASVVCSSVTCLLLSFLVKLFM